MALCGANDTGGLAISCYDWLHPSSIAGSTRMRPLHLRLLCALAAAAAIGVTSATAHHTFVRKYDSARKISLSGTVDGVRFSNPHIFFTLETSKGSWTIETEGVAVAKAKGLTTDHLKDGAKATVTGWPARDGTAQLGLATIAISGGPFVSMRGTAR